VNFKLLGVHGFRFKKLAAVTHEVVAVRATEPGFKRRRANAVPQLTTLAALMHRFICVSPEICFEGEQGLLCAAL
jgi:hypothetical protein